MYEIYLQFENINKNDLKNILQFDTQMYNGKNNFKICILI